MKTIVTGVAGFIGSHLAEELINCGHEVLGIDCFTDYYSREIKEKNIINLLKSKKFSLIEKNILGLNLEKHIKDKDAIFHEAAQAGVRKSWGTDFDSYVDNNIRSTQVLLEASKNSAIKYFVYASSSSIYGNSGTYPVKEDKIPKPISPYGVTKLTGEHLCNTYKNGYGLPIIILRYFTVYGPRQRPDMAFNKFIRSILLNQDIPVYGKGLQTRDFTFISDIVEANMLIIKKEIQNGIFNIGGGANISLNEAIRIIENLTGKEAKVKNMDIEKGDVKDTFADISRANEILNYKPKIGVKEGLFKEIEWIKANIK